MTTRPSVLPWVLLAACALLWFVVMHQDATIRAQQQAIRTLESRCEE